MALTEESLDTWKNKINGLPYAFYLYYLDSQLDFDDQYSQVIGNATGLVSVVYTPFLKNVDLDLAMIPYDTERFGELDKIRPELNTKPMVYRVKNLINPSKFIAKFKTYPEKEVIMERSWKNESKLLQYPYSFIHISDGLNPPLVLKPELCPYECDLGVKLSLSERGSYSFFVQKYKGDTHGFIEALVSTDGNELPSTESQYATWIATSKNQTQQAVKASLINNNRDYKYNQEAEQIGKYAGTFDSGLGVLGSILSLNPIGGIKAGMSGVYNYFERDMNTRRNVETWSDNKQNIIQSNLAKGSDMKTAPNTLISQGSNIMYGLRNNDRKVKLYRFGITEEYAQRLGDYFALYGYKQNKMMKPDLRSRLNYNYVKMLQCNMKTHNIPQSHLEELKGIFERGIRLWHVDDMAVDTVGDYSRDNAERQYRG